VQVELEKIKDRHSQAKNQDIRYHLRFKFYEKLHNRLVGGVGTKSRIQFQSQHPIIQISELDTKKNTFSFRLASHCITNAKPVSVKSVFFFFLLSADYKA
jgi:hypothetical protein